MNYELIMQRMINENKSIREMALELGIPKSTLHYRLEKYRKKSENDVLLTDYDILLKFNKDDCCNKGAKIRWKKKKISEGKGNGKQEKRINKSRVEDL